MQAVCIYLWAFDIKHLNLLNIVQKKKKKEKRRKISLSTILSWMKFSHSLVQASLELNQQDCVMIH